MTLIFENETGKALENTDMEALAARVCEKALDEIGCPFEAQVSLTITDSDGIRRMNSEFRGIDAATDVLSFPVVMYDAPGRFDELLACIEAEEADTQQDENADEAADGEHDQGAEAEEANGEQDQGAAEGEEQQASPLNDPDDCFDPESGELQLGDIVINLDRVYEQASAYGHSVVREYAFLLVHSMLHLCGYDHMESEEAEQMEAEQERILQALGITRG